MKTLIIITILSCVVFTCRGQMINYDSIFVPYNLEFNKQKMLPYQIASGSIVFGSFLINETIIRNRFNQAYPYEFSGGHPETLVVYVSGISLALVVMIIGFYKTYK